LDEKINLFDFGEAELQSRVDPRKNLRSTDEVSRIHDSNVGRHFSPSLSLSLSSLLLLLDAVLCSVNGSFSKKQRWHIYGEWSGSFSNSKSPYW